LQVILDLALPSVIKDVARALRLLPQTKGYGWRDYGREVAAAAAKDYPQEAIKIYKQKAESAIEERGRASYHRAADYLKRVKRLCLRLNEQAAWSEYMNPLRETYKRLPAFQDELRKADL
jgi:uncharacterized Zn finger protein